MTKNSTKVWLKSYLRPLRRNINEVIVISVFINFLALAAPIFTLQIYDRIVGYNGFSTLQGLVIGIVIIVLFDFILRQARSRILQNTALQIDVDISRKLFNKLMSLPMQTLEKQPSAYWLTVFYDADTIREVISGKTATLIADLPFAFLFLVIICIIATPIAWVFLIVIPIFMFFLWHSAAVTAAANQTEQEIPCRIRIPYTEPSEIIHLFVYLLKL